MADSQRPEWDTPDPATLHGVMRAAIAHGLQEHYEIPQKMPHALLVLMMQLNEDNKKQRPRRPRSVAAPRSSPPGEGRPPQAGGAGKFQPTG